MLTIKALASANITKRYIRGLRIQSCYKDLMVKDPELYVRLSDLAEDAFRRGSFEIEKKINPNYQICFYDIFKIMYFLIDITPSLRHINTEIVFEMAVNIAKRYYPHVEIYLVYPYNRQASAVLYSLGLTTEIYVYDNFEHSVPLKVIAKEKIIECLKNITDNKHLFSAVQNPDGSVNLDGYDILTLLKNMQVLRREDRSPIHNKATYGNIKKIEPLKISVVYA